MNEMPDIFELVARPRAGALFVFAGPSGAGKTTLCRELAAAVPGLAFSVSHTTRAPRDGEADGRDYYFVADEVFGRMVAAGEFAEHAVVHGRRYGTSRAELDHLSAAGADVLLDIDVQGAAQIRARYPAAVAAFVLPPSMDELRARLLRRGQNDAADIERRMAQAEVELAEAPTFDYFVVNGDLAAAVAAARAIVLAERQRLPGRRKR